MVILRSQNKITDFLMILAWASPFNVCLDFCHCNCHISIRGSANYIVIFTQYCTLMTSQGSDTVTYARKYIISNTITTLMKLIKLVSVSPQVVSHILETRCKHYSMYPQYIYFKRKCLSWSIRGSANYQVISTQYSTLVTSQGSNTETSILW